VRIDIAETTRTSDCGRKNVKHLARLDIQIFISGDDYSEIWVLQAQEEINAKLEALHTNEAQCEAGLNGQQEMLASRQDSRFDGLPEIHPAEEDFLSSSSRQFWAWSTEFQNWYHFDEQTKSAVWAPLDFD
jgi:ribosomal protein S12 methylthiotransferase accessory factor YcaO